MWSKCVLVLVLVFISTRLLVTAINFTPNHREPRCLFGWRWVEVAGGDTLTLTSPYYPASYDYFSHCGWTIWPTSRNVVLKLKCNTFHLQESKKGKCRDYLRVQQDKYCGSSIPVISTKSINKLAITFHSNGRFNYPGFNCSLTASNPNTQHCVCGEQSSGRAGEAPWVASLVYANDSQAFCTASIVRERWVLTSASCAARIKYNKYNYAVLVGEREGRTGVRLPIKKVFLHPVSLHRLPHTESNLALIHLKEAITFHSGVTQPVCLPLTPAHHRPASHSPVLRGWRGTEVKEEECPSSHLGPTWLCGQPKDSCHPEKGDLGSPLVSRGEGGDWVQVGVAVDSDGCAADRHVQLQPARYAPAVYTSVIKHLSWISKTLGRDNTCSHKE